MQPLIGSYDLTFVALSIVLAICASYAALDLAGRINSERSWARIAWLAFGAAAMGLGIWAMHYVGMLALMMPMKVSYHLPTVAVSLLAAIAASGVALYVVSQPKMGRGEVAAGSVVMGGGIAAMHYIGMAAIRGAALVTYNSRIVALSIVLAIAGSFIALELGFHVRYDKWASWSKAFSAVMMGCAIALMHYTGMWAASFHMLDNPRDSTQSISLSALGTLAIGGSCVLVLVGTVAVSIFDRYLALQKGDLSAARQNELYFRTMAEAVPEIIWTATPRGEDDYFNQKLYDYTGMTFEQLRGAGWNAIVHPDDLPLTLSKWKNALEVGEPYEIEYRLLRKDGVYRWFLGRANPIRDTNGRIIKWFGITTDIEDQKHNQEVLQQQVQEQTSQLADANTRLQKESYFRLMADAVPQIIWTSDAQGNVDYSNRYMQDYGGKTINELSGMSWLEAVVHPDDRVTRREKLKHALQTGEPYDFEYRLRGKDGDYRWFLLRVRPIRNEAGEIEKWIGTCTDIDNQKQNQKLLEEQILERTMQLEDANTRLQEEMIEKDFARNELDLQNEKMVSELQKRSERATMLAKMGELLQSCISRDEVFSAALGYAPKIFPSVRGVFSLLNGARTLVEVIGSWGNFTNPAGDFEPSQCWALRTGHPHLVVGGDITARCAHADGINETYLCVPIMAQGETLGVLHFQVTEESPQMDPSELSFKTTFAGQIGLSIANIRLREALRTQSVRDPLTGLYNRRYLEEILEREVRRAGRANQSLGILMLDLDHFKGFNDTYGHDAGDTVLRETAAFLLKHVRAEDFVCRFGGEEFVVILPTADEEGARGRGERFRAKMRDLTIMHQGKSLGMITFSIGVAAFPQHGMSPKDLMAAADAALYEAKRGGRDQVVVAVPAETMPDIAKSATATWS
jgi:diguanylate cyclase (GGDEF)-like protein/PAS domain S-box-containing protein